MKESNTQTLLVMVTGFLVLSALLEFYFVKPTPAFYLRLVALGIGVASFIPPLERLIVWFWGKFALVLGWINTRILLSVVFYIFLTPFGILSRVFSKNSNLKLKNDSKSTFVERNHTYTKKDLENIW
ncbi:MAG: hypothetical protein AAF611_05765 [Bacteroidota bacterium]